MYISKTMTAIPLLKEKGATLWIGHDINLFGQLKKSPAYYD